MRVKGLPLTLLVLLLALSVPKATMGEPSAVRTILLLDPSMNEQVLQDSDSMFAKLSRQGSVSWVLPGKSEAVVTVERVQQQTVARLLKQPHTRVMITNPQAITGSQSRPYPLLLIGEGVAADSLIYSDSTHRYGLMVADDIRTLQVDSNLKTQVSSTRSGNLGELEHELHQWRNLNLYRNPILWTYALLSAVTLLLLVIRKKSWDPFIEWLLWLPFIWLGFAAIEFTSLTSFMLFTTIGSSIAVATVRHYVPSHWYRKAWIALFTILLIELDTLLGSPLLSHSVIGSDPLLGARFYGIGNEGMGIWIGYILLLLASLDRFGIKERVVVWIGQFQWMIAWLFLASPIHGSNAGGTIAVSAAWMGWTFFPLKKWSRIQQVLAIVSSSGLLTYLMLFWAQQAASTHVSRFVTHAFDGHTQAVWEILSRKWGVWKRLLLTSPWSRLLVLNTLVLVISHNRSTLPQFRIPIGKVTILTACTALLFNDSGVVATAILLVPVSLAVLADPSGSKQQREIQEKRLIPTLE